MNTIMKVRNLKKHFPIRKGLLRSQVGNIKAVDGVSFDLQKGETLGLVGESGCGKTTTARCINRLLDPTEGRVEYFQNGTCIPISELPRKEVKKIYKNIQMIFQDPSSSLNPRMMIKEILGEPLLINGVRKKSERVEIISGLLEKVGLNPDQLNRFPHEFSGGQRQRIGIARALSLNPEIIICDEPVSALDVSIQAQIINLLKDLQNDYGLSYIFVAHDLSIVEYMSHRVAIMYLGRIVEIASTENIFFKPLHPYTQALISAIPVPDPDYNKKDIILQGEIPSPANPPSGCPFHPRCMYKEERCCKEIPVLRTLPDSLEGHQVACHRAEMFC